MQSLETKSVKTSGIAKVFAMRLCCPMGLWQDLRIHKCDKFLLRRGFINRAILHLFLIISVFLPLVANSQQLLDTTAPTATISDPAVAGDSLSGAPTLSGSITDNAGGSGVAQVSVVLWSSGSFVSLDGSALPGWTPFNATLSNPNAESSTWTLATTLPPGSYTMTVYPSDAAGNYLSANRIARSFQVVGSDTTAPTATISDPATVGDSLNTAPTLSGSISDEAGGSGVAQVSVVLWSSGSFVSLDGSVLPGWTPFNATLSNPNAESSTWTLATTLPPGSYTMTVYPSDVAGNYSPANRISRSFSVASVVANVAPLAVADSVMVEIGGSVSVAVLANDEDSDGSLVANTVSFSQPGTGSAALESDGTVAGTAIVYTHDGSGSAGDEITFIYTVEDDAGELSNQATVTVTITAAPNTRTVTIAPIGDSITNGGNSRPSYRRALWQKLQQGGYDVDFVGSKNTFFGNNPPVSEQDFDLDHEGHWAEEAGFVADNIDAWLTGYTPDIVIMHLGTNDFDRGQSNQSTLVEFESIIASLRADNPLVTILVAEIIPLQNQDTSSLNTAIRNWAPAQSTSLSPVIVVDQYTGYNPATDSYDNYHPNAVGEEKMASRWFSVLQSVLDGEDPVPVPQNVAPVAVNDDPTQPVAIGSSLTINVLSNDTDSDGTLDVSSVVASVAAAVPQVDGTIVYTPTAGTDVTAPATFTYTVEDNDGAVSNAATVTVDVFQPAVNEQPQVANASINVVSGSPTVFDAVGNATDADGTIDATSVDISVSAAQGTTAIDSVSGEITYTANAGVTVGTIDSFGYTVMDDDGLESAVATITVTFVAPSVVFMAVDDADTVVAGNSVMTDVLDNDTGDAIDPTTVTVVDQPDYGAISIDPASGVITYTPDEGVANITDVFSYTVEDDASVESNIAAVSVVVNPAAFMAVNDNGVIVHQNGSVVIDVLANDTGPIDAATVETYNPQQPTAGFLSIDGVSGAITYSPYGGQPPGEDNFGYRVRNSSGVLTNVATVSVTIVPPGPPVDNDAPIAVDDSVTITAFDAVDITVLDNDSDPDGALVSSSVAIVDQPINGTVSVSNGVVSYTHDGSLTTDDSFSYTVSDNQGQASNVAVVAVTVNPHPPVAPEANDDLYSQVRGTEQLLAVLENDLDRNLDLDSDSLEIVAQANNGDVSVQGDAVVYLHDGGQSTSDTFSYKVFDAGGLESNVAVVDITITGPLPNIAPVAVDDSFNRDFSIPQVLNVLSNDSDSDGTLDLTSIVVVTPPASGTAVPQSDGTVLFTHSGAAQGTETFTYTVGDDVGMASNIATVTVSPVIAGNAIALHRSGQTFLTWDESAQFEGYHVYRSNNAITQQNINTATRLTDRWGPLDNQTSQNPHGGTRLPGNYVIEDQGSPLRDDQGLFVYTTRGQDSSTAYYAVTGVSNGVEDISSLQVTVSVNETVASPRDVLTFVTGDGTGRFYTQFMDYSDWNPTYNGYAYNYVVIVPSNYNPAQVYPLHIIPHAHSEVYDRVYDSPSDLGVLLGLQAIHLYPHDPGETFGFTHSWWFGYSADHNYLTDNGVPDSGVIENFTEQRVMRSIDTLIANSYYNIDETLIHATGNSMGASGALSWGMRYPSVLSGIYASQPMTNYQATDQFKDELVRAWGAVASNLPIVNDGPHDVDIRFYGEQGISSVGVWDWMNHHQQLVDRRGDTFAYLMVSHGKQDPILRFQFQGAPTVAALTNANAGFSAVKSTLGHSWSSYDAVVTSMFGLGFAADYAWKYPLGLSFPAIQNASGSSGILPAGNEEERHNLNIEWATSHTPFDTGIVDLANRYEITIRSNAGAQTADITPRRTRQFSVNAGQQCNWVASNRDSGLQIGSGSVVADLDSLVTVRGLTIATGTGTRLVIDCGSGGPIGDPDPQPPQPMAGALDGDWTTGCFLFDGEGNTQSSLLTLSISGTSSTFTAFSYSDLDCSVPAISETGAVILNGNEDTLVFPDETVTTTLGEASFINFTTQSSIVDSMPVPPEFFEPITLYSIYTITNDGRLFFGSSSSTTPANRPTTLDVFFYYSRM